MIQANNDTVALSRRELTLILRRILVARDVLPGLVPAVGARLLDALVLGRPALEALGSTRDRGLDLADVRVPGWRVADGTLTVDGRGQWAPLIAPAIADLVRVSLEREGIRALAVHDAHDPALVEGARGALAPAGILLEPAGESLWTVARADDRALDAAHERLTHHGLPYDRGAWLDLYRASLDGLAPEFDGSDLHAGYVDADGRAIERMDDDEDIVQALEGSAP